MEFEGTVFKMLTPTSGQSARGQWQRQDVVFDMKQQNAQYPRKVCVTFFNRPDDVAKLRVGEQYKVSFDIESREYNERWFTDIRAWRVQPLAADGPAYAPQGAAVPPMPADEPVYGTTATSATAAEPVDDLPF